MSENHEFEESPEDRKSETPEEGQHGLSEEPVLPSTINYEPSTNEPSTANMEVHHHPQVEKKNFKEYFLEFIMIFLAVTLGFFCRNDQGKIFQRMVRQRSWRGILYKETLADSVAVRKRLDTRRIKEDACVYFINYVRDSSMSELSQNFFPSFTAALIQSYGLLFEPNDGILNQLKNSGELRYFKSGALQEKIGELGVSISNIRNRNEKEYSFIEMYLRPFSLKYFDFKWYDAFTDNGKISISSALLRKERFAVKGKLSNPDQFNRKEAENLASYYLLMLRGTKNTEYTQYIKINHELLESMRATYDVEHE